MAPTVTLVYNMFSSTVQCLFTQITVVSSLIVKWQSGGLTNIKLQFGLKYPEEVWLYDHSCEHWSVFRGTETPNSSSVDTIYESCLAALSGETHCWTWTEDRNKRKCQRVTFKVFGRLGMNKCDGHPHSAQRHTVKREGGTDSFISLSPTTLRLLCPPRLILFQCESLAG